MAASIVEVSTLTIDSDNVDGRRNRFERDTCMVHKVRKIHERSFTAAQARLKVPPLLTMNPTFDNLIQSA